MAELVGELDAIMAEARQVQRLLRAVTPEPLTAAASASHYRQVAQLVSMSARIVILERIKLEQLAAIALHSATPGGSA